MTGAETVLKWMKEFYEVNGTPNYGEIISQLEMAIDEEKVSKNESIGHVIERKGQLAIEMLKTSVKIDDVQQGGVGDNDDALIDSLISKYEKCEEEYNSL